MIGQVLGDAYRLVQRLDSGGYADYYRARDRRSGADVIVKILHADVAADTDLAHRFVGAAELARTLRTPLVVRVLDSGVAADGAPYVVLEHIAGRTLAELLRRTPRLPTETILALADRVLTALDAAHNLDLVHRDIKPRNVIVDGTGALVALDIGAASLIGARPTTTPRRLVGTPEYMAPEQLAGHPVDRRTDLYAVGVVLYLLLTGHVPFTREPGGLDGLIRRIRVEAPPSLADARPDLPAALIAVVERALDKVPSRRFQSAREMQRALAVVAAAYGEQARQAHTSDARAVGDRSGTARPDSAAGDASAGPARVPAALDIEGLSELAEDATPRWEAGDADSAVAGADHEPTKRPGAGAGRPPDHGPAGAPAPDAEARRAPRGSSGDPPAPARRGHGEGGNRPLAGPPAARPDARRRDGNEDGPPDDGLPPTLPGLLLDPPRPADGDPPAIPAAREPDTAPIPRRRGSAPSMLQSVAIVVMAAGALVLFVAIGQALGPNPAADPPTAVPVAPGRTSGPTFALPAIATALPGLATATPAAASTAEIPTPLPAATPVPAPTLPSAASPGPTAPGPAASGPLISDAFDDARSGTLSARSSRPTDFTVTYDAGEYVVRKVNPELPAAPIVYLPGAYGDSIIAVDVRLADPAGARYALVVCRDTTVHGQATQYRATIVPDEARVILARWAAGRQHVLAEARDAAAVRRGSATNRLELRCVGTALAVSVNGTAVASVQDTALTAGAHAIGAGAFAGTVQTVEARFDNLLVRAP